MSQQSESTFDANEMDFLVRQGNLRLGEDLRYDTICYFNVRSKADMSQFNLSHGNNNYRPKKCTRRLKTDKLKSKNGYAQK